MAALILAKLMVNVEGALASQQSVKRSKLWLNSQTALFWIMNRGEWKQFVKHSVNEILKLSDKGDWRYCPSQENPADVGSRGMPASELNQNVLWWQGPAWLTESEESWPSEGSVTPTTDSREEERTTSILVTQTDLVAGIDKVIEIDKYGCIRMVLRVTAWLKWFCFNVSKKTKSERKHGPLSLQELTEAEIDWMKAAQRELKCQENYKQLSNKFTNSKVSQEGPSLWSEEYPCRIAHQILGPQGETSCEEDIVPVCDMQEVGGYCIYPTSHCEFTRI